MTMTLPLRLMILHFSHMGLTDGLTFMFITSCTCLNGPGKRHGQGRKTAPVVYTYLDLQVMRPRVRS